MTTNSKPRDSNAPAKQQLANVLYELHELAEFGESWRGHTDKAAAALRTLAEGLMAASKDGDDGTSFPDPAEFFGDE